jgi:hypothetical protein
MDEKDKIELARVNAALNAWMNRRFFGAPPVRKRRGQRSIPCPICGKPMKTDKELCFFCRQVKSAE